jgi:signal transduction histidine kinase
MADPEPSSGMGAMDEQIALASHDMRTPLAAVRGYAQLARRHLLTHPTPDVAALDRWLTDIDEAADRLTSLVSEFLDATIVRDGAKVPLQLEAIDLVMLVRQHVKEHRRTSNHHRFSIRRDSPSIIGRWDPSRLGRALDNLLSNAAKFSPDSDEIGIQVGSDGACAFVAVTDHGIGIAPEDLERLFDRGFRGANAARVSGVGLGLYGASRLIEQMGGTIEVASRLGKGSTFTILLPLAD